MVPKITAGGHELMIRALAGEGLVFTKIVLGKGTEPEDYYSLTGLVAPQVECAITEYVVEEKYVQIKGMLSNSELTEAFPWTEVGVYVEDPDSGNNILYAYDHYRLDGDQTAPYIQPSTSHIVETSITLYVYVGEVENATIVLSQSQYAPLDDFQEHTRSQNPHGTTKEDIGLGKVQNDYVENLKPVFSEQESVYSGSVGTFRFANIFSGESIGYILQKVRTLINLFVRHMNTKNPHKLDPGSIGAAGVGLISETINMAGGGNSELDQKLTDIFLAMTDNSCKVISYYANGYTVEELGSGDYLLIIHRITKYKGSIQAVGMQTAGPAKRLFRCWITSGWKEWTVDIDGTVDYGSDHGWHWRKYANGDAECWGARTVEFGQGRRHTGYTVSECELALPFDFVNDMSLVVSGTVNIDGNGLSVLSEPTFITSATGKWIEGLFIKYGTTDDVADQVQTTLSLRIIGHWK